MHIHRATYCPVPVSPTLCGLLEALSVTFTFALRVPVACGVKVTVIVQDPPAETKEGQLLVWEKSALLTPMRLIAVIVRAVVWRFVSIVLIGLLELPIRTVPKLSEPGENVTGLIPVPFTLIVCGLLLALSEIVTVPDTVPATVGVKVTVMLQVEPAAMEVPQVFC